VGEPVSLPDSRGLPLFERLEPPRLLHQVSHVLPVGYLAHNRLGHRCEADLALVDEVDLMPLLCAEARGEIRGPARRRGRS